MLITATTQAYAAGWSDFAVAEVGAAAAFAVGLVNAWVALVEILR